VSHELWTAAIDGERETGTEGEWREGQIRGEVRERHREERDTETKTEGHRERHRAERDRDKRERESDPGDRGR